ncbi:hypothetical protein Syun_005204 [Stephania yunnanensis]|uniref:DUF4228 domain-containing protein n=1 Tax=Stephania yunnanensis TaxID=152371 RepID=A0AAP0Q1I0_9MAGN
MGNCQAAEAATVVIIHPGSKIERIYWSVSANQIMASNPGNYVALVVSSQTLKAEDGTPLKQLKLLRPDDTLHIGQVYRLVSFEEVLKEFAAKKSVKLGRLLKEKGLNSVGEKYKERSHLKSSSSSAPSTSTSVEVGVQVHQQGSSCSSVSMSSSNINNGNSSRVVVGRQQHYQPGQWRPALQSISEIGS